MFWGKKTRCLHVARGYKKLGTEISFTLGWTIHPVKKRWFRGHSPKTTLSVSLFYYMLAPQIYLGVILRARPDRGESHIQRHANQEVATTNRTDRTFFLWFLHLAWPSNPDHSHHFVARAASTLKLYRKDRAASTQKLCTVAASNNGDHPMKTLYNCLFARPSHIYMGMCVFCVHSVRSESHIQRHAKWEVAANPMNLLNVYYRLFTRFCISCNIYNTTPNFEKQSGASIRVQQTKNF